MIGGDGSNPEINAQGPVDQVLSEATSQDTKAAERMRDSLIVYDLETGQPMLTKPIMFSEDGNSFIGSYTMKDGTFLVKVYKDRKTGAFTTHLQAPALRTGNLGGLHVKRT